MIMAANVPAGTVLDFTVRGTTEWSQFQVFFTPTMLQGNVQNILSQRFAQPVAVRVETGDTVITGTMPWSYTASVRVKTIDAHAFQADVGSIIANAFYQACGTMPNVSYAGVGADADLPAPVTFDLPSFSWPTALVVAGVAVLVLAWKF